MLDHFVAKNATAQKVNSCCTVTISYCTFCVEKHYFRPWHWLQCRGAANLLQAGRADVQDTADVSTGASQSAHHSVAAIIGRSASRRALQTDRHRQTILQLRRTYSLEL